MIQYKSIFKTYPHIIQQFLEKLDICENPKDYDSQIIILDINDEAEQIFSVNQQMVIYAIASVFHKSNDVQKERQIEIIKTLNPDHRAKMMMRVIWYCNDEQKKQLISDLVETQSSYTQFIQQGAAVESRSI